MVVLLNTWCCLCPQHQNCRGSLKALKVSINKLEGAFQKKKKQCFTFDYCAQSTLTIACFTVRRLNHKCNYHFFFFSDVQSFLLHCFFKVFVAVWLGLLACIVGVHEQLMSLRTSSMSTAE